MCDRCDHYAAAVDLLTLEADVLTTLLADGTASPTGNRPPTADEVAAGLKFGDLDDMQAAAESRIARETRALRDDTLDAVATELTKHVTLEDPADALDVLNRLTDPTEASLAPLRPRIDTATRRIRDALADLRDASAQAVYDEAAAQGVPAHVLDPPEWTTSDRATLDAFARDVATEPVTRVTGATLTAARTAAVAPDAHALDVIEAALDAAEATSTAGVDDVARQAANVAFGIGRQRAAAACPTVERVYASELRDGNTCKACARVDGRVYESMTEALKDYPGAGGFIGCYGGNRCRGLLVFVHATEQTPTVTGVDERGEVPDLTPRKATGVKWPAHIDDVGRVIPPTPEDLRFVPPPDAPPDDLDDFIEGATEPYERPAEDVARADAEALNPAPALDSAWADTPDDELRAALDSALADGSDDALAYAEDVARELDTRARLGHTVEATIDTAADVDDVADQARRAADVRPRGRKIDRVREDWDRHIWDVYDDAEAATNGYLVRRDLLAEFRAKGFDARTHLFQGNASTAYRYASPELREWWETHPRLTFDEWAVQNGISDRKTMDRARRAKEARQEAAARAEEDPQRRKERQAIAQAERRRRRGPLTEGEKLQKAQDRAARERRRAEGDQ